MKKSLTLESGIYQIINNVNNNRYIGSTANFKYRWYGHRRGLRKNKHRNLHLQNAWNKYDEKVFEFQIIEKIENPTKEKLIEREQYYLDNLKPEYNICQFASSRLGVPASEETRKKISEINSGSNNYWYKKSRYGKENPFFGKKHTDETKQKIRETIIKREISKGKKNGMFGTHRDGENNPFYSKRHSEESKQKIRDKAIGRLHSKETKMKISNTLKSKNRKNSLETIEKMRQKRKEYWENKGRIKNDETR